jgi:uncharacterized OB-fold protein
MGAPFKTGLFREHNGGIRFIACRCDNCGAHYYPKRNPCARCFSTELQDIEVGPNGEVFTYSTVFMPTANFKPPYVVGYVTVGPVRVFAPIEVAPEALRVGLKVIAQPHVLRRDGENDILGYKFVAV